MREWLQDVGDINGKPAAGGALLSEKRKDGTASIASSVMGRNVPKSTKEEKADEFMVIKRVYQLEDGTEEEEEEVIRDRAVIDAYLEKKQYMQQLAAHGKRHTIDYEDDLRVCRWKVNEEFRLAVLEYNAFQEQQGLPTKPVPEAKEDPRLKKERKRKIAVCKACGQEGHVKTSDSCPFWRQNYPARAEKKDRKRAAIQARLELGLPRGGRGSRGGKGSRGGGRAKIAPIHISQNVAADGETHYVASSAQAKRRSGARGTGRRNNGRQRKTTAASFLFPMAPATEHAPIDVDQPEEMEVEEEAEMDEDEPMVEVAPKSKFTLKLFSKKEEPLAVASAEEGQPPADASLVEAEPDVQQEEVTVDEPMAPADSGFSLAAMLMAEEDKEDPALAMEEELDEEEF